MRAILSLCFIAGALSGPVEDARARIDRLPREISASRIPTSQFGACSACSAGTFSQLANCLTNTNVCIQLTNSFTIIDPIEIGIPSYTLIQTPPGTPARTLTGNGRQLFLVKNIGATLVLDNVNLFAGVNEFSGYQGGGGAVQVRKAGEPLPSKTVARSVAALVTAGNLSVVSSLFAYSSSGQQGAQVDIGGGAVSCMDQGSALAIAGSALVENVCYGCSGGAVFSFCSTYIGDTSFYNNSVFTDGSTPAISGGALRSAQIDNIIYFVNSTVIGNGIATGAAMIPAVSLSATTGTTTALVSNVSFGDNLGGGIAFTTDPIGAPTFAFQVGNSSFVNCSTSRTAGGAISIGIASGNGAAGVGDSVFSGNVAVVGGAISVYDGNETNTATVYLQGNTFACNEAIGGVGTAVNNGNTKGDDSVKTPLLSIQNNFAFVKGCAAQTVLGPCEGAQGQCPEK